MRGRIRGVAKTELRPVYNVPPTLVVQAGAVLKHSVILAHEFDKKKGFCHSATWNKEVFFSTFRLWTIATI